MFLANLAAKKIIPTEPLMEKKLFKQQTCKNSIKNSTLSQK